MSVRKDWFRRRRPIQAANDDVRDPFADEGVLDLDGLRMDKASRPPQRLSTAQKLSRIFSAKAPPA